MRRLFSEGLVDENGIATVAGRTLARRLMAEEYIKTHGDDIAQQLIEYAKQSKAEGDEE